MDKSSRNRRPPAKAAFLAPEIELYRREKAAAIARGANITTKVHHDFYMSHESCAALCFHPAYRIGDGRDGCYLVTTGS